MLHTPNQTPQEPLGKTTYQQVKMTKRQAGKPQQEEQQQITTIIQQN